MFRKKLLILILTFIFLAACESGNKVIQPIDDLHKKQTEIEQKNSETVTIILNEILENAKFGLVKDSEFSALDNTMEQVKERWGEPDQVDRAGAGYYAVYETRDITFGYHENGEIFDVRSYSKNLQKLTFDTIEKSLGGPIQETEFNGDNIYTYQVNENIQLKFVISEESNFVDHISVFNPQKAVHTTEEYNLEIKGKSNRLSDSAWERMLEWREQIVDFSKGHENVFVNGPNKKRVALTFDDGPDEATTSGVIDILEKYDVIGNFFFVGSNVKKYPDVVKTAFEKGHLVLSHSYNHVDLAKLANKEIQTEIQKTEEAIKTIIGKRPAMIRPPFGETDQQVATIAKEEGYSVVLWSIDTLDWSQREAVNIVKNVIDNVRNGDIILMHTTSEQSETQKALPTIIEELQKRNIEIIGLDTLLHVKAYQ